MAFHRTAEALRQLGQARMSGLTDAALLAQFAAVRDESAFAELVHRHGPLVLGVCLRTVGHRQDAEDAFQATFLILAAKAAAVANPGLLGNWLYGVAYRVARKARRAAARRRAREVQVATFPDPPAPACEATDAGPQLDAALAGLPEVYRSAIVLCDLQQKSRSEAAALLGIPEGTLSSRLAAGRKKLAAQLGATTALTAFGTVAVPADLAAKTVQQATEWAVGGVVAAHLKHLISDGGPIMGKATGVIAAALAAVGLAVGAAAAWPGVKPDEPKQPTVKVEPQVKATEASEKPAKAKMLANRIIDGSAKSLVWSPDGSSLAMTTTNGLLFHDGRTLQQTLNLTQPHRVLVGFPHAKPEATIYLDGRARINSVTRLEFWYVPTAQEVEEKGLGTRLIRSTDFDPSDGYPFALSSDGKTVLTVAYVRKQRAADERPVVSHTKFRSFDANTGEVIREIVGIDASVNGYAATPDGRRLVILKTSEKGQPLVECLDVETGTSLWTRTLGSRANPGTLSPDLSSVLISYDGSSICVTTAVSEADSRPPGIGSTPGFGGSPGRTGTRLVNRLFLLSTSDGKSLLQPDGTTDESWSGLGFSHDGKLFVAKSGAGRSEGQLRIWDVRSGKILKTWEGHAEAAFAPDRPTLAILEHYQEAPDRVEGGGGGPRRAANKSSLGLWDLSALVK